MLPCILAAGCSAVRPDPPARQADGRPGTVVAVPFYAQEEHQCGPAALAMALGWAGADVGPEALTAEVFTPERKGSLQPDLITAARRHDRVAYVIGGIDELHAELDAGNPVVVLQNLGLAWIPRRHYAVAVGYHAGDVVLHTGAHRARRVVERTFANTWERAGAWGLVVLPAGRLPATATEQRWLEAALGLEEAGRFGAAAAAYRAALERWPQSLVASIGLANSLYAAGEVAQAESALRSAVAAHPSSADAWNNLAQALADLGRVDEARTAARTAVGLGGPRAEIYERTLLELQAR
jgi:tetratricopeptide (TPR) repeat protein